MAYEFYVSVTGEKQKKFKGEARKPYEGRIPGVRFSRVTKAAVDRDPSGALRPMGTRHEEIVFAKEWDATSPQFVTALAKNEMLINVLFEFTRASPKTGDEEIYYTIELTKAWVLSIRRFQSGPFGGGEGSRNRSDKDMMEVEEVAFTFDRIEEVHRPAKTMSEDSWSS